MYRWRRVEISLRGETNDPYSLLVRVQEGPTRDVFKVTENRPQFSRAIAQVCGEGALFLARDRAMVLPQALSILRGCPAGAGITEPSAPHEDAVSGREGGVPDRPSHSALNTLNFMRSSPWPSHSLIRIRGRYTYAPKPCSASFSEERAVRERKVLTGTEALLLKAGSTFYGRTDRFNFKK